MTNPSSHDFLQAVDDGLPTRSSGIWAKNKLNVLSHYITTSTLAMRDKPWRRRFYIDLQAGPGKNHNRRDKHDIFLGSPILALTHGARYTDYRFVEQDSVLAEALRKRCQALVGQFNISIKIKDCNDAVDEIVDEIQNIDRPPFSKTDWNTLFLAFLDPEGLELHWETVSKLASLRRTDLLINFSIGGLRRTANQSSRLVDQFFGTTKWKDIPIRPSGKMPSTEWIELYKERLTEMGYLWGEPISVKIPKGVELYRLLFASKHELGIQLWNEARKGGPSQLSLL